jgi:hypothetical protein
MHRTREADFCKLFMLAVGEIGEYHANNEYSIYKIRDVL